LTGDEDALAWDIPGPDNLSSIPFWEDLVVSEAAGIAAGLIPKHTLAFGVRVDGPEITFVYQMSEITPYDQEDMDDVMGEFWALGWAAEPGEPEIAIVERPLVSADDGVRWVYVARPPEGKQWET
jgi:hypothetical protein